MKTEAQTIVACAGDSVDSLEMNESFVRNAKAAKEQHNLKNFGRIGYEAYLEWVLKNQLPLS